MLVFMLLWLHNVLRDSAMCQLNLKGSICAAQMTQDQKTTLLNIGASLRAQLVKNVPAMQETPAWLLGQEEPLEKG